MRHRRLSADLNPTAKVAGLDPRCRIPGHADRPAEPEPAQQVHAIRTLGRIAASRRLEIPQILGDWADDTTAGIHKPKRLERIACLLKTPQPGHDEPGKIVP